MDARDNRYSRSVISYLPECLVEEVIENPVLSGEHGKFCTGTLVFADISGFTAMSEKLSDLGKEGAEELTEVLNRHFTHMLRISSEYGGSLLKFGGDAMLLLFPGQGHAARGARCALRMQYEMRKFRNVSTSAGTFKLAMSIGVNSGEFLLAGIGEPEKRLYIVFSGREINRTAEIEAAANAGEVYIGKNTVDELEGRVKVSPGREGFYLLESLEARARKMSEVNSTSKIISPSLANRIVAYLPEQFAARLVQSRESRDVYGEHRRVTVMFINILGISEIIEEYGNSNVRDIIGVLHRYFDIVQESVSRYGGLAVGCDLNTRGEKLLILFGAPVAHEDDDERAVRCALEMKKRLQESGLPITQKFGINTGFVFSGDVGSPSRMEYTVMGDNVNLAARIMGTAQTDEIIIGQTTFQRVSNRFNLTRLAPVRVKGKSQPVMIYRVEAERREVSSRTVKARKLIGRIQELAYMNEVAGQAQGGSGQLLAISGAAGTGKSQLIDELISLWRRNSEQVYKGDCQSYNEGTPFYPWLDVLNTFFGIEPTDTPASRSLKITETINELCPYFSEWTAIIGKLLSADIEESPQIKDLDSRLKHQRLLDMLLELVQARSSKEPMLLVLQDIQWADSSSLELIEYIVRNIVESPVLVCIAFRPEDNLSFKPRQTQNYHEIALGELSTEQSLELACSLINVSEIPSDLASIIVSRSRGNPLFIEEIMDSLIESGYLKWNSLTEEYELAGNLESFGVPDTLQGLIMSRVDQLDDTPKRVLKTASVIGQSFQYDILNEMLESAINEKALTGTLSMLEEVGFILSLSDETPPKYQFKNALTQEVAYETILYAQRRKLHENVGIILETKYESQLEDHLSSLAFHFNRTRIYPKAFRYSILAGEKAKSMFTNKEAIDFNRAALKVLPELQAEVMPAGSLILERLGDLYELTGQYEESFKSYQESLDYYINTNISNRRQFNRYLDSLHSLVPDLTPIESQELQKAILSRKAGLVQERIGQYQTALDWLEKALGMLSSDIEETAGISYAMAGVLYRMGQHTRAMEWCEKGLEVARKVSSDSETAHGYYLLGTLYTELGNTQEAITFRERSLDIYEKLEDKIGQARVHNNLGVDYYYFGNWEKAKIHYNRSLEIRQQMGDVNGVATVSNNLGEILSDQGYYDEAVSSFQTCLKTWQRIGYSLGVGLANSNLGRAYNRKHDGNIGLGLINKALYIFEEVGSRGFILECNYRLAETFLELEQYQDSLEYCEKALGLARECNMPLIEGAVLRVKSQTLNALGETRDAKDTILKSKAILEEINAPYELACTLWELSVMFAETGDRSNRDFFSQAVETFSELGVLRDPFEMARLKTFYGISSG